MNFNYELNGEILKGGQIEEIVQQIIQIFAKHKISIQSAKFILDKTKEQIEKTIID